MKKFTYSEMVNICADKVDAEDTCPVRKKLLRNYQKY